MKFEQKERPMLFSETVIPDLFFTEYLSQIPGDYVKIYLQILFLSKYNKDIKVNDLSKTLTLPFKTISEGTKFLEESGLIIKKGTGYVMVDIQEEILNRLYKPNLILSPEKVEQNSKNKSRLKAIQHINNEYFQGTMGPVWLSCIDLWFNKFNFDEQVMIALFGYCHDRGALHKNYVQTVAEAWGAKKIKTWPQLEAYYQGQEKLLQIKKSIAKKMGKRNGLTQYEEAYIEKWVTEYKYEMDVIEIALRRTTFNSNPNFEYINNIITDWHERNLKTPAEVEKFLEQRKKQSKEVKQIQKQIKKAPQRKYDNLDFLYSNKEVEGENDV